MLRNSFTRLIHRRTVCHLAISRALAEHRGQARAAPTIPATMRSVSGENLPIEKEGRTIERVWI